MSNSTLEWWKGLLSGIDVWSFFVSVVAVCGAFYLLSKVWPTVKKIVKFSDALSEITDMKGKVDSLHDKKIPELTKKLNNVHHEVFPNSGRSMRDELDRNSVITKAIHSEMVSLKRETNKIKERVEPITGQIEVIKSDLEETVEKVDEHLEDSKALSSKLIDKFDLDDRK